MEMNNNTQILVWIAMFIWTWITASGMGRRDVDRITASVMSRKREHKETHG